MKRKGRSHLPKVGTPADNERVLAEKRARAAHPFATDAQGRRGPGWTILGGVLAVVVVLAIIALLAINA